MVGDSSTDRSIVRRYWAALVVLSGIALLTACEPAGFDECVEAWRYKTGFSGDVEYVSRERVSGWSTGKSAYQVTIRRDGATETIFCVLGE